MKKITFISLAIVLIASVLFSASISAHRQSDIAIYAIKASAGVGGSISPSGSLIVYKGESVTYTITPNEGYRISCVLVDGIPHGKVNHFTFRNIRANHIIVAIFSINKIPRHWGWER